MSERIVDNPANHGWVEENGKWVWEGGATTGHIEDGTIQGQITTWDVAKAEWTPENEVKVASTGISSGLTGAYEAMQITTSGNASPLFVSNAPSGKVEMGFRESTKEGCIGTTSNHPLQLFAGGASALTLDTSGDATFSGHVCSDTGRFLRPSNNSGIVISSAGLYPDNGTGSLGANGTMDLGGSSDKFKNGYFSGTVDAAGFTINGVPISGGGGGLPDGGYTYGYEFVAATSVITCVNGNKSNGIKAEASAGSSYRNTLAHTDYGLEFQSNSSSRAWKFTNGGGDRVVISTAGNVTATDFIATSDERVKDNITTAPVGLIDSLKGREWDWQESGEKGSGVVAQELEKVLPHLVHEDEDGMKSVAYNGLLAYVIEELKECRERLALLEGKQ